MGCELSSDGQAVQPGDAEHGLRRDLDAVTAVLTLYWSSGSIEGAVNCIKKIKRQLYGRAGFHLLRKMILLQWPGSRHFADAGSAGQNIV
uniref:hypothetical protein n=1 Tax=Streptomyces lancefieldiae TaxID=3075520 RepID=UPI00374E0E42